MFLNCHTAFSFKYGTLPVESLYQEAKRYGVRKLAITEINNTASYIEMLRYCMEQNADNALKGDPFALEIVVGVEFRKGDELLYITLAKNNEGFEEINRFLSFHNMQRKDFPMRAPRFDHVFVIYPFKQIGPEVLLDHEFIGIRKSQLVQLSLHTEYKEYIDKYVVLHPVTFSGQRGFNIHRLLRAIDHNTLLSKLPPHAQAQPDEMMVDEASLQNAFASFPQLVEKNRELLNACSFAFTFHEDKNKQTVTGNPQSDWDYLVIKTWEGFQILYRAGSPELRERLERELTIIRKKNFCAYYLIAYDLITFAQQKGYAFVGRGSGANSLVAYCLGITNVDPIELDLYFERFLNEERTSPPDFDIDFSWDNRDAIYAYLFEKYGPDHICLLGTHVTYQKRSVIRELGKVFGLPKDEIDAIVEAPHLHRHRDHITSLIFDYAEDLKDLPANISIHAGGVLITEKPIYAYTALAYPPKGYPVSHFEMYSAEDFGIFKFDILSQRGLGHIKESVRHIRRNRGTEVDMNRFAEFKQDEKIKSLLRNSQAMGCFYVESPAMRMLLGKLRCEDYLTLVAASSIIRPGVASSGMMRAYIERYHLVRNGESYTSVHPKMDELLKETYGVMVYQEEVIKVAHYFAGLTLTEADVLRRGMSGKYRTRNEFKRVKDRFFDNCRQKGYDETVIERVWYEIESFSGYSFAKGHSASYAVESFQSLYLKAHYPLEFMVGVINNFGGFYKTEFYFHEARMNGARIEAPCVNTSDYLTTIYGEQIYMGLIHLKGLEKNVAMGLILERQRHGAYKNMDQFLRRNEIGLEQIRILIRIGAFRFTGKSKQRLLWEAMLYFSQLRAKTPGGELFETEPSEYPLPALNHHPAEDAFDEIELLGFTLSDPFELLATSERGNTRAQELHTKDGSDVYMIGYLVTTKETSTRKHEHMHFGTFYDHTGHVFDTVHFPAVAAKYPFRGRGFYALWGVVTLDFGIATVQVSKMEKLGLINRRAEEFMREFKFDPIGHSDQAAF